MKSPIILLLFFFSCLGFSHSSSAQYIKVNEYNAFTGEHYIETGIASLKSGYSTGFGVALRSYGKNIFLSFIGYGKKNRAVTEDERVQFLLQDGSVVRFNSRVQLPSNESAVPNLYIHHYIISKLEVEALQKSPVLIVRKVSLAGQEDIAVNRKLSKELISLCESFLAEMNKF